MTRVQYITYFVNLPFGNSITFNSTENELINNIKNNIENMYNINSEFDIKIYHNSKILNNNHSLKDCNINDYDNLHVIIPLRGGSDDNDTSSAIRNKQIFIKTLQ